MMKIDYKIESAYKPRWIKNEHIIEIFNLWHLSKVAPADKDCSRYSRLIWTATEFAKKYDYLTRTAVYKDLECLTRI